MRSWFYLPAAVLLVLGATLLTVKGMRRTAMGPSEFGGGAEVVDVALRVSKADPAQSARQVVQRLAVLGVSAQVTSSDAGDPVRLRVFRVRGAEAAVRAALVREPVRIRRIDASLARPVDGGYRLEPLHLAPSRPEVEAQLTGPLPPGRAPAIECGPAPAKDAPRPCAAWLVEEGPALHTAHVSSVRLEADPRTEEPLVVLELTAEGARIAGQLTSRPGASLAVEGLDEILARPVVGAQVAGRQWRLSTRTPDSTRRSAVAAAERLRALFMLPALPGVELLSVEPVR